MAKLSFGKLPPDEYHWTLLMNFTLVQVMAWCRQATSHCLSQCWPRSLSPYGVTRPQWFIEVQRNSRIFAGSHWPFWKLSAENRKRSHKLDMMTSSNEKPFPRCWPFVRGIHRSQRPMTRSFDVFFDLRLNKRLSKQSRRRWFETP